MSCGHLTSRSSTAVGHGSRFVSNWARDEIGSTATNELRIADDLLEMFDGLGLDRPSPIPVLAVEHQVAQKLHACTSLGPPAGANERAHDLVDLQILDHDQTLVPSVIGPVARRLFAARNAQPWPTKVVAYPNWGTLYAAAAEGLDVLPTVAAAVAWANDLIEKMSA